MRDAWDTKYLDGLLLALLVLAAVAFVGLWRYSTDLEAARHREVSVKCSRQGGELLDTSNGFRCVRRGAML